MAGNSYGEIFKVTTFGESHGPGVGVVVDGCPPRLPLIPEDFAKDMGRRRPGVGPFDTITFFADRGPSLLIGGNVTSTLVSDEAD